MSEGQASVVTTCAVIVGVVAFLCLVVLVGGVWAGPVITYEGTTKLKDGRSVVCLQTPVVLGGALSCDWARAERKAIP